MKYIVKYVANCASWDVAFTELEREGNQPKQYDLNAAYQHIQEDQKTWRNLKYQVVEHQ